jgi:hypothetical protein
MRGMLNILVGSLAGAFAYGALITWSRQRVFTATRAAERYEYSRASWAGNERGTGTRPTGGDDSYY